MLSFCRSLMKALKEVADKDTAAVRIQGTPAAEVAPEVGTLVQAVLDYTVAAQVLDQVRNGELMLVGRKARAVVLDLRNPYKVLAVLHKRAAAVAVEK